MSKIFKKIFDTVTEVAVNLAVGPSNLKDYRAFYESIISGDKELSVQEFMRIYDMRMYNFSNKQNDIKFMKNVDFKGVYILHNISKEIYLVGHSDRVFKKMDRHFRGYENPEVYSDWKKGDVFLFRVVEYDENGDKSIDVLHNEINESIDALKYGYKMKLKDKHVEDTKVQREEPVEKVLYCSTCGVKIKHNRSNFCTSCGSCLHR